jgi:hypothetical protein
MWSLQHLFIWLALFINPHGRRLLTLASDLADFPLHSSADLHLEEVSWLIEARDRKLQLALGVEKLPQKYLSMRRILCAVHIIILQMGKAMEESGI